RLRVPDRNPRGPPGTPRRPATAGPRPSPRGPARHRADKFLSAALEVRQEIRSGHREDRVRATPHRPNQSPEFVSDPPRSNALMIGRNLAEPMKARRLLALVRSHAVTPCGRLALRNRSSSQPAPPPYCNPLRATDR